MRPAAHLGKRFKAHFGIVDGIDPKNGSYPLVISCYQLIAWFPRRQRAGDLGDDVVHKRPPSICARQLLRNAFDVGEGGMDIGNERLVMASMRAPGLAARQYQLHPL